jgi:hypothetical protein
LNHGTIASPIPGAEMQVVAQRLRDWASQVGALRLGEQADPEVNIHLAGVDLQPILAQAAEADTAGARKNAMRRLLFQALELDSEGTVVEGAMRAPIPSCPSTARAARAASATATSARWTTPR